MRLPDTLPAQVYLLAYDRRRQRASTRGLLGLVLGGAALADLWLSGHLVDDDGVARPAPGVAHPMDPALRLVWERVTAAPASRRWTRWVRQQSLKRVVRDALADSGVLRVEPKVHWWGRDRVTVRDTRVLTGLEQRVGGVLRGPVPVGSLDARDAALVAVVAVGEVSSTVSRAQRRAHKQRLAAIVARGGPPVAALRQAIRQARSASAG